MDGKEIAGFSSEIAVMTEAHYYLTEMHNFHTSELEYLMQFKNPLQLVADEFEADGLGERSTVMWRIFDRQEHDEYELMPDTLAQEALDVADAPVNAAADTLNSGGAEIAALHERLIERAEQNWHDYRHSPYVSSPDTLFRDAVKTIGRRDALDFIKNYKDFTAEELNCLLQFADPVDLVADYLDPAFDISVMPGVLENILEEQENFKGHYPLAKNAVAPSIEELTQQLHDRLDDNFAVYKRDMLDLSKEGIFYEAAGISAVTEIYNFARHERSYTENEATFLLKFENPLEVLSDGSEDRLYDVRDSVIWALDESEWDSHLCSYALASDDSEDASSSAAAMPALSRQFAEKADHTDEKPSVMAQIKQARQSAWDNPVPPKDPQARNKSEPDL